MPQQVPIIADLSLGPPPPDQPPTPAGPLDAKRNPISATTDTTNQPDKLKSQDVVVRGGPDAGAHTGLCTPTIGSNNSKAAHPNANVCDTDDKHKHEPVHQAKALASSLLSSHRHQQTLNPAPTNSLQQRLSARSNGNSNATIIDDPTNTLPASKNIADNAKHKHTTNIQQTSNTNNADGPSKPAIKLNGLRNRIIQRPPPLILDKVSNFYDNTGGQTIAPTSQQRPENNHQLTLVHQNDSKLNQNKQHHPASRIDDHSTIATNAVTQYQAPEGNASTELKVDSRSYSNINGSSSIHTNSANHKFWASLNENASRNKALAIARSSVAASATVVTTTVSSEFNGATDSLGADLVISHRNSIGAELTNRLQSNLSTRKQSRHHPPPPVPHEELQHQRSRDELNEDENNRLQNEEQRPQQSVRVEQESPRPLQALIDCPIDDQSQQRTRHDLSNNSTEPDDNCAPSECDGGNLIGVDNPTPPAAEHPNSDDLPPNSATSIRSRSNNPFLNNEPDLSLVNSDQVQQQEHHSFHKRPASFIAATARVSNIAPPSFGSTNFNKAEQKIVEERFNDLQLTENSNQNNSSSHSSQFDQLRKKTISQRNSRSIYFEHPLDQRDSQSATDRTSSVMGQSNNDELQTHGLYRLPSESIYGISGHNFQDKYSEQRAISLDSESAVCQPPPSATMQLPHWTDAIYELKYATLEASSVAGGAEIGQFIYVTETGDIILEIDHIKVSGFTLVEFIELIESKQFHLRAVQTKHSYGLTIDLKQYLNTSFSRDSEDKQLQNLIRENIYRRTIPCTTRPPKSGEIDKVDYHFLTKDQFIALNNKGMLLECGVYSDNYYGTLKPSCDLASFFNYQTTNETPTNPFDGMRQSWDLNHPAIDMVSKREVTFQANTNNENPLYENQESLKMFHQQHDMMNLSQPLYHQHRPHRDGTLEAIAVQNSLQLENRVDNIVSKPSSIVAVDSESLPPGWERVIDQTHGTYYIDHNTQRTQYERPYEVELTKGSMGFGFTLVEADSGILLVKSIIPGGPAHLNGMIRPGDILVSAVGVSVSGLQHTDIARLFSTFAVGDRVRLTFARGTYIMDDNLVADEYLFSNGTDGNLAIAVNSNSYYTNYFNQNMMPSENPHIFVDQEFEFITVTLKRGDQGFGFTISDSMAGQKVRKIQNHEICSNLKQGDILTVLNGDDITKLTHKEVVEKLKQCPAGQDVSLTVKRRKRFRSKTPMALHTNFNAPQSIDSTPQRNCKTPSIDSLMLRRPQTNYNSGELLQAGGMISSNLAVAKQESQVDHPSAFVPHPMAETLPPSSQVYGTLTQQRRPQPILSQPIYESRSQPNTILNQDDIYYRDHGQHQQQSLPPLHFAARDSELSRAHLSRPASIPSSDIRDNMTGSMFASDGSLIPNFNPSTMNSLNPLNQQYNNFMNNDKLVMLQMQQHQQQYQSQLIQPQHQSVPVSISDYHHVPLYSNSEVLKNQHYQSQPQVPAKPTLSQHLPNLYSASNFQNNFYANNEEISLQRAQYGSGLQPDEFGHALPVTSQLPAFSNSASKFGMQTPQEEQDEYEYHHVDLDRENTDSNWGIRLIGGSEVDRAISIGSIVFGSAASKNGKLKSGDEIISINGVNVVGATHQHVVELISACSNRASLVVRRNKFAEACEVVLTRSMKEGFGFVIISSENCALIGRIIEGSPADRCKQLHVRDRIIAVNGRYITPNMQHPEIVNMIKECGSTLRMRIIPVDCYTVELIKNSQSDNFGFSMRGGSEYDGTPLYILRVAPNGLARDLLNVGDQILEINNIPTVGMTHQQAATIIKYSDPIVKLKLRRNYVIPPSLLVDSPRALQKFNQVTAEMKTVVVSNLTPNGSNPNMIGCDATSQVSSTDVGAGSAFGSCQSASSVANMNQFQLHHHSQQHHQMFNPNQQQQASLANSPPVQSDQQHNDNHNEANTMVYEQLQHHNENQTVHHNHVHHHDHPEQHHSVHVHNSAGNHGLPLYAS